MLKGKTVLVSGGAGFIGSHLVRRLVAEGAHVRVLDNLSSGSRANLAGIESQIDLREGDVRNAIACRDACRGVDAVFHMAAYISVPGSVKDPVTADAINIGGTLNMLMGAASAGAHRFVLSSSAAVYGDTDVIPTHEDVLPQPLAPYGLEKLYGEHCCRLFLHLHGLEALALRYFNVFGPRQNPNSEYAAVIPKFITTLLAGEAPTIFGDGEQTRDFLFVEDVVQANLLAATREGVGGRVFNVAGGHAVTLNELAEVLASVTGTRGKAVHGPERPGDIRHSCADTTRAREVLGFTPSFTLEEGLARTVEYYRSQNSAK